MTSVLELVYARYQLDVARVYYLEKLQLQYESYFPEAAGLEIVGILITAMNLYLPLTEELTQLRYQCGTEAASISAYLADDPSAQAKKLAQRLSGLSKVNSDLYRENQQLRKQNEQLTQINQNYKAQNAIVQQNYATLRGQLDSRQKSGTFELYTLGYKVEQLEKQLGDQAAEIYRKSELLQQIKRVVGCEDEAQLPALVYQGFDALDLKERMAKVDRLCLSQQRTISLLTYALEGSIRLAEETRADNLITFYGILERCGAVGQKISTLGLQLDVLDGHVQKCDTRYLKYKQKAADALRQARKLESQLSDDCLRLEQKEALIQHKIPLLERIISVQKQQIQESAVKFEQAYLNLVRLEKELAGLRRVDYVALLKTAEKQ